MIYATEGGENSIAVPSTKGLKNAFHLEEKIY